MPRSSLWSLAGVPRATWHVCQIARMAGCNSFSGECDPMVAASTAQRAPEEGGGEAMGLRGITGSCREGLGSRQSHQISYPEQIELGDTAGTSTGQPQHAHAPSRPQGSPESVLVSVYGVHILAHCQSGQIHAKGWCPRAGHLARRRCHELDQQFKLFLH